jgi:hypothetical protein
MGQQFFSNITNWVEKAKGDCDQVVRDVLIDLSAVVPRTPVDTGHAQANWQFGTDSMPTDEIPGVNPPDLAADIQSAKAGHIHYLVNNVPYIGKLEYGGYPIPGAGKTVNGFSTQAPAGMARLTMLEVKAKYSQ